MGIPLNSYSLQTVALWLYQPPRKISYPYTAAVQSTRLHSLWAGSAGRVTTTLPPISWHGTRSTALWGGLPALAAEGCVLCGAAVASSTRHPARWSLLGGMEPHGWLLTSFSSSPQIILGSWELDLSLPRDRERLVTAKGVRLFLPLF